MPTSVLDDQLGGSSPLPDFLLSRSDLDSIAAQPKTKPAGLSVQVGPPPAPKPAGPVKPGVASIPTPPVAKPAAAAAGSQPDQDDRIATELKDPETRKLLAETMVGEGLTPQQQQVTMEIILNRARQSGQTIRQVIEAEGQFTSMDYGVMGSRRAALDAMSPEQLQSATALIDKPNPQWKIAPNIIHSFAPDVETTMQQRDPSQYHGRPAWAPGLGKVPGAFKVGNTEYYPGTYGGGKAQTAPAGGAPGGGLLAGVDPNAFMPSPEEQRQISEDHAIAHAALKGYVGGMDAYGQELADQLKRSDEIQQRADEAFDRYTKSNEEFIKALPDEHKIQAEELAKVSDQPGDPSRVLGQFLPMLAILGGAFTKAGVVGSLNAAGAAMNAARTHDEEALKKAHEEYQDQITEVMDKATLVHQELSEAITKFQGDNASLLQRAKIIGDIHQIPLMVAAAANGDAQTVIAGREMLSKGLSEVIAMARQANQQYHEDLVNTKLLNDIQQGGKPQLFTDQATGRTLEFWPERPVGHQTTDLQTGQEVHPAEISHVMSGRLYGGISGAIQAAQEKAYREGRGELTPDEVIQVGVDYTRKTNMAKDIASGPMGNQIQAFNSAIGHLDTLHELMMALKNGDVETANRLRQMAEQQFGYPIPTEYRAIARIVGQEVTKAIVPGAGGEQERAEAGKALDSANSPEQIAGVIEQYQAVMATQLNSIRTRYEASSGAKDFSTYLTPRSQAVYTEYEGGFGTGLKPEDKGEWVKQVQLGRNGVRQGWFDKEYVIKGLRSKFPDATEEQIERAVAGIYGVDPGAQ